MSLVLLFGGATTNQTVTPDGIASAETLGAPSASPGPVTINLTGISTAEAAGTPTITPGPVTISLNGIASAEALGALLATPGVVTISPSGVGTAESVGNPTITLTLPQQTVYPDGISGGASAAVPSFVFVKNRLRVHLAGTIYR